MDTIRDHRAMSIVALLVLAGAIVGGVALLGGGSSSTSSTESALQATFPGNTFEAAKCEMQESASPDIEEQAVCTPGAGTFLFSLFPSNHHRDEAYNEQMGRAENQALGAPPAPGHCQKPNADDLEGAWYHDYSKNEEMGGQALCYIDKDHHSHLIWTYDSGPLLVEATRSDDAHGTLQGWFDNHAHKFMVSMPGQGTGEHGMHQ